MFTSDEIVPTKVLRKLLYSLGKFEETFKLFFVM
jgi:hypothetical protein